MPDFDFDIKKKDWRPKCVDDVVKEVGRSFEADVTLDELFIMGTDYVQKKRIQTESELSAWLKADSKTYEKLIKVKVPDRLLPKNWQPKKMMVLTRRKDNVIARYFADEEVSTRQVQFTLKILECGHFRLKQTLQGSGPSPYWVIFEGKWTRSSRGYKLEFCIRYPFQKNKKDEFDLAFEAMPDTHNTSLAFTDETEKQLSGQMPAIVGSDAFSWVELVQEHETESNPKARFNLEDEEGHAGTATPEATAQSSTSSARAPARAPPRKNLQPQEEADWSLYLVFVLFLAMVAWFSWNHWGPHSEL
mmetsp:Transcript_20024/g.45611  ORF Transcript_20024/g.45611 Transcript_20024/m.45611 type:complete len:304 (+) Transcript_20024:149-1060(+)